MTRFDYKLYLWLLLFDLFWGLFYISDALHKRDWRGSCELRRWLGQTEKIIFQSAIIWRRTWNAAVHTVCRQANFSNCRRWVGGGRALETTTFGYFSVEFARDYGVRTRCFNSNSVIALLLLESHLFVGDPRPSVRLYLSFTQKHDIIWPRRGLPIISNEEASREDINCPLSSPPFIPICWLERMNDTDTGWQQSVRRHEIRFGQTEDPLSGIRRNRTYLHIIALDYL